MASGSIAMYHTPVPAGQSMTLAVDESDTVTTNLARVLLACEIAAQVLTCFIVVEMMAHGSLSYKVDWYMAKAKAKLNERRQSERMWRQSLGRMFFEVQRTLEEAGQNG